MFTISKSFLWNLDLLHCLFSCNSKPKTSEQMQSVVLTQWILLVEYKFVKISLEKKNNCSGWILERNFLFSGDNDEIMCSSMVNTNPRRAKPRFAGKVNVEILKLVSSLQYFSLALYFKVSETGEDRRQRSLLVSACEPLPGFLSVRLTAWAGRVPGGSLRFVKMISMWTVCHRALPAWWITQLRV